MDKHSKVSSSTEWRLGENVVLRLMECLTPTVSFDIFMNISHLFVSLPTLELTTFEQQVCSASKITIIWNKQLQNKQKSSVTLTVVS